MTRDEVLAMKPGREMDDGVAEHIIGLKPGVDFVEWPEHQWKRDSHGEVDMFAFEAGYHNGPVCERCGYSYCEHCQGGPTEPCIVRPEPYSTDDAAALKIIPAVARRGWDFALYYEAASEQWNAYFLCNSDEDTGATATATSLPEAVCKAALLALLEEADAT